MKTQLKPTGIVFKWILPLGIIIFSLGLFSGEATHRLVAAEAGSYEINQVDTIPVIKKAVRIRFPSEIRKRGGEVTLRFLVTKEGKVKKIGIVKFSDSEMIEQVYGAYEKALFSPGLKDGIPVATWMTVTEKAK